MCESVSARECLCVHKCECACAGQFLAWVGKVWGLGAALIEGSINSILMVIKSIFFIVPIHISVFQFFLRSNYYYL